MAYKKVDKWTSGQVDRWTGGLMGWCTGGLVINKHEINPE